MAQPVFLIVPGGFIKPEAYSALSDHLTRLGYKSVVPPLTVYGNLDAVAADSQTWKDLANKGCEDDVHSVREHLLALFEEGQEAIIMGHSYGSLPACLAIEGQTTEERSARGEKGGVKAFVNLAGFAYPVRGKNIIGSDDAMPPMPYHILEAGILQLQDDAKPLFFSDLSPEAQDQAWRTVIHKTQSHKSLQHRPQFLASDLASLPKYYLRTLNDAVVSPEYQAVFIQHGKFNDEFELDSGHCPMTSEPEKLAEVLVQIAKR